jgi:hypothetical protein
MMVTGSVIKVPIFAELIFMLNGVPNRSGDSQRYQEVAGRGQ